MSLEDNGANPGLNWKDSIATNITFFREQTKALGDVYSQGQVASGSLMTVMIMNHNMLMGQIALIHQRLTRIEQAIGTIPGESGPPHRD